MVTSHPGPKSPATTWIFGMSGSDTVGMPGESFGLDAAPDGSVWLAGFGRFLAQFDDGEWTGPVPGVELRERRPARPRQLPVAHGGRGWLGLGAVGINLPRGRSASGRLAHVERARSLRRKRVVRCGG
jgi:hypothetical protein